MGSSGSTNRSDSVQTAEGRQTKLLRLAELATAASAESLATEANALARRVAEDRFFVACVGQFKRGKSSLLNALVQAPVLPTGVVPVTAILTILRYGAQQRAEVHFVTLGRQEIRLEAIADYVSEEHNPRNKKGVTAVEVFLPSQLLASGMCLVDTPGIGSVFAGNTAVTRGFVPHIDAALVVLGADPPISGEELALVEEVAAKIHDLIFVLNKADRLGERDCDEATLFAQHTLAERIRRPVGQVFRVSAYEWLNTVNGSGPSRDEVALRDRLQKLALESGADLVRAAEERGLRRLGSALLAELSGVREALLRPVEDSRRLVDHLATTVADAERSLNDLGHLFKAEQERVNHNCAERRDRFLARALPAALKEFHDAVARIDGGASLLRGRATVLAQEISRRWLDRWLSEERPAAEAMYRQSAERFVRMANEFLERLAASGDTALAELPRSVNLETGFTKASHLYYGEHFGFPRQTFASWLRNIFSARQARLAALDRQVGRYLDTLLTINSTRILNDFDERVRESGRRLEAQIRSQLREVRETARRTLERAARKQTEGIEAVHREVERLDSLRQQVLMLLADSGVSFDRMANCGGTRTRGQGGGAE
jgi:hypothetical protein